MIETFAADSHLRSGGSVCLAALPGGGGAFLSLSSLSSLLCPYFLTLFLGRPKSGLVKGTRGHCELLFFA